jgi:hypothetical protein
LLQHQEVPVDENQTYSNHAYIRCQQRGISRTAMELVLNEGDLVEPAGDHCERIRLSRMQANHLRRTGMDWRVLERVRNIAVIYSRRTAQVVTVMHVH